MPTFSIPWPCPECGCGDCAHVVVTCRCCGNTSLLPGPVATVQPNFYAGLYTCPYCATTWAGNTSETPPCETYTYSVTTFTIVGASTFYLYLSTTTGLYEYTEWLSTAQSNAVPGTITDNCGASVP